MDRAVTEGQAMRELSTLRELFLVVRDPRIDRTKRHDLADILAITTLAVIAGADTFEEIEAFGRRHANWLKTFLSLEHGIPSHDTFRRVLGRIAPEQFTQALAAWIAGLRDEPDSKRPPIVAIDGKVLRRSFDRARGRSPLTMVSAFLTEQGLCLGQKQAAEGSNEIATIPQLIELLDVSGCVVTIDAAGCQKSVLQRIRQKQADYLVTVKKNRRALYGLIKQHFDRLIESDFAAEPEQMQFEATSSGHGRQEYRSVHVVPVPTSGELASRWSESEWCGAQTVAMVVRQREQKSGSSEAEPQESWDCQFALSSLPPDSASWEVLPREHWQIENGLHWTLDVAFGEDASRVRRDHAAENLASVRRLAVSLLKQDTTAKQGIKSKRKIAGWDTDYLTRIITAPGKD